MNNISIKKCTLWIFFLVLIAVSIFSAVHAVESAYIDSMSKKSFKKMIIQKALSEGVSEKTIDKYLKPANIIVTKKGKVRRRHWSPVPFAHYKKSFIKNTDWPLGVEKYKKYYPVLKNIEKKYGVDPGILVAIWASETGYGDVQGKQQLIPTLLTQAYVSHRQKFMVTQLISSLQIVQKLGAVQQYQLQSTYDGGMGMIQMEPSTYLQYAVSYYGSGQPNIWKSVPDALSSAANLLNKYGWQAGLVWGVPIKVNNKLQRQYAENKTWFTVADLGKLGLSIHSIQVAHAKALRIIYPNSSSNEGFLVTNNFKVLMRWNKNTNQALVVGLFADHLRSSK